MQAATDAFRPIAKAASPLTKSSPIRMRGRRKPPPTKCQVTWRGVFRFQCPANTSTSFS
jgi:hypothetical protein